MYFNQTGKNWSHHRMVMVWYLPEEMVAQLCSCCSVQAVTEVSPDGTFSISLHSHSAVAISELWSVGVLKQSRSVLSSSLVTKSPSKWQPGGRGSATAWPHADIPCWTSGEGGPSRYERNKWSGGPLKRAGVTRWLTALLCASSCTQQPFKAMETHWHGSQPLNLAMAKLLSADRYKLVGSSEPSRASRSCWLTPLFIPPLPTNSRHVGIQENLHVHDGCCCSASACCRLTLLNSFLLDMWLPAMFTDHTQ